jgi:hypothetical protein
MSDSVALRRVRSQLSSLHASPHAVVSHFGAIQAQDYLGALWAIGTRMRDATEGEVERAIANREIVRCWPMRGTLHFAASEDVRWMLDLLAPRALQRHRTRLERDFDLDSRALARCEVAAERALRDGNALTRPELYAALEGARISTKNGRGLQIIFALAHRQVLCFGARRGKQQTFVLLDEWVPPAKPRPREEALAELARRYFTSHGPATPSDFAWWSGLTAKEANEAIALAGPQRESRARSKRRLFLLPPFDEFTVAYRDRSDILDPAFAKRVNAGGGMLNAVLVIDGIVSGTWKRTIRGKEVEVAVSPFRELTRGEMRGVEEEAKRYARFLGLHMIPPRLSTAS